MTVNVKDLGLASYKEVWNYQEELFNASQCAKKQNVLPEQHVLLVEHPHVYTLGKSGLEENLLISALELNKAHAEFFKVNRGGDITYHGPGQLVVYPIFDLEQHRIGVREYIERLEQAVINTIVEYGIVGERLETATGVWIDAQGDSPRKICAIGVKCSRYVTMHGLALNANTDLNYFNYINPCGFVDKGVTSIQKEIGAPVGMDDIKCKMKHHLSVLFNY
ncbi:MAG: lipoyl(octanoyl) transferase LipB [Marinifilaceae bacterium]